MTWPLSPSGSLHLCVSSLLRCCATIVLADEDRVASPGCWCAFALPVCLSSCLCNESLAFGVGWPWKEDTGRSHHPQGPKYPWGDHDPERGWPIVTLGLPAPPGPGRLSECPVTFQSQLKGISPAPRSTSSPEPLLSEVPSEWFSSTAEEDTWPSVSH